LLGSIALVALGAFLPRYGVERKLKSIEQDKERQGMADEQKTTQKRSGTPFDFSCWGGWPRMKADQTNGWDWAEMMSKIMEMCSGMGSDPAAPEEPDIPFDFSCCGNWSKSKPDQTNGWDWAGMMSKIMEMCSGMGSEPAAPEEPGTPDNII
jgi:hypothetical protein